MEIRTEKRRLRVAVVGTRGIPGVMGGVETHCEALYPRLAAKGHSITIFARKGYTRSDSPYSYEGVKVVPVWAPRKKSLEAITHTVLGVLMASAKEERFDILHVHAIGPSLLVPLARALGHKVVMTHHGPDYDRDKWGALAKRALRMGELAGCRYSDCVITVSRHIRGSIKDLYGRDGEYIPNGVPVPEIIQPGEGLARHGLEPARYILAVGRFVPEKGFHDLISAFKGVNTGWKLVIAGKADHEDSYSKKITEMAAGDGRVVLTGFITGRMLGEIYSNAGLFVLPSYHEGLPIALLEAMSHGLPVLASDIPANMELLDASESYPAGNAGVLSDRLRGFIESPRRGTANRDKVATEYDWDRVAEDTEAVYMRTLAA